MLVVKGPFFLLSQDIFFFGVTLRLTREILFFGIDANLHICVHPESIHVTLS